MKTVSSAEFRKRYAKLTETTVVTVNGHGIGVWTPWPEDAELLRPYFDKAWPPVPGAKSLSELGYDQRTVTKRQQSERDAILRKINKRG